MLPRFKQTLAALAALALVGCGAKEPAPPGEVAKSNQQRLVQSAPAADFSSAVAGNTEFTLALYKKLAAVDDKSLFFSPYSISTALAMTYAGSAGTTKQAFEQTMHITLADDAFHRAMNDLDYQLTHRGQGAKAADGKAFRLNTANQLFAQKGFPFESPFLDKLAVEYGADVRLMSFDTAAEPARVAINEWVSERTEKRIPELLESGTVDASTRLVLVNAIYFNAAWKNKFEESLTSNQPFHLLSGTDASVPTMRNSALPARAAKLQNVDVVELPYDGEELSLLIFAPPAGGLQAFESALDRAYVDNAVAALERETLDLSLPKFEIRSSRMLKNPLSALGLGVAFSEGADFSAMSKEGSLSIDDVIHQAFVKVNEEGTEAAAATAVVIRETSLPQTREVKIDRPFIFTIRDNATGALVFMGRVTTP